jgi:hypothetical protein
MNNLSVILLREGPFFMNNSPGRQAKFPIIILPNIITIFAPRQKTILPDKRHNINNLIYINPVVNAVRVFIRQPTVDSIGARSALTKIFALLLFVHQFVRFSDELIQ